MTSSETGLYHITVEIFAKTLSWFYFEHLWATAVVVQLDIPWKSLSGLVQGQRKVKPDLTVATDDPIQGECV